MTDLYNFLCFVFLIGIGKGNKKNKIKNDLYVSLEGPVKWKSSGSNWWEKDDGGIILMDNHPQ